MKYPNVEVVIQSFEEAREEAINKVFSRLKSLDIETAKAKGETAVRPRDLHADLHERIMVSADHLGPFLNFMLEHEPELIVKIDPTMLDRSDEEQEEVFQKCAAIVAFMQDAPRHYDTQEIAFDGFDFWNGDQQDDENWKSLGKIWAAANKK